MRGLKEDRSAKVIIAGLDSYRTFGEDTTSWRWTSQRAAGWLSRSTSWPWRSDLNQGRKLQHAAGSPNATVPPSDLVGFRPSRSGLLTDRDRAQRMGEAAHRRRVGSDYLAPRRLIQDLDHIDRGGGLSAFEGSGGQV
jgi:hypothetical protein